MDNQEWTIQRHWKHWSHKTQDDEEKTNTIENKNTTQHRKLFKEEQNGHTTDRG